MHTDWNCPPWPVTIVTICMSCFMSGDPDKGYGTNKPPPTGRVREMSKGDNACPSTSQNPIRPNPITIKPETASHVTAQFSWVPLPYCSPPRCPFPIQSLALSACVSPQTIHFWILDKRHFSGPGNSPPSCNRLILRLFSPDIHCYKISGKTQG